MTAWWNVQLALQWRSPLFPLYNALFKSPYLDLVNYHDGRWKFDSLSEFLGFLVEAAFGTYKTSEARFADVRLLIVALLFGVLGLAWALRHFTSSRRLLEAEAIVAKGLLCFFGVSFSLWAFFFAYQRYLIPLELLSGVVIWIIAKRVFHRESIVSGLLAMCLVTSFTTLSVPDWGHRNSRIKDSANPFGLGLPAELVNQAGDYLVTDPQTSYIFPFMHRDSRFLNVVFSPRIDELIRKALAQNATRAVRVLSHEATAVTAMEKWARFGFVPGSETWYCWHFRSSINSYVVCEVRAAQGEELRAGRMVGEPIAFDGVTPLPPGVIQITGLSVQEPWGRWSIEDEVQIHFAGCLPEEI